MKNKKKTMVKGLITPQRLPVMVDQDIMSNLTSSAISGGQTSVLSSGANINGGGGIYPHLYFPPPPTQTQPPPKKKRKAPGNPEITDPDAEVIAFSPETLMATNRYVCEKCNKCFTRDQNLQLHRRAHNLPWKPNKVKDVDGVIKRKKVYVCPEAGCVHHEPSRALGDLTGVKKHFCRKHGEKKWKCDKCPKLYALQSDLKTHSKTCGTREYICDCGNLFSRRDSYNTHKAFCDAIAEESAISITPGNGNGNIGNPIPPPHMINQIQAQLQLFKNLQAFSMKKEQINFSSQIPTRLAAAGGQEVPQTPQIYQHYHEDNPNPSPSFGPGPGPGPTQLLPAYTSSANMSATVLLQKAVQMGATISTNTSIGPDPQADHVSAAAAPTNINTIGFGLNLSSRDQDFFQEMMMMCGTNSSIEDYGFAGFLNFKKDEDEYFNETSESKTLTHHNHQEAAAAGHGGGIKGNDDNGMTRDFLGLRPPPHTDILNIVAMQGQHQQ